MILKKPEVLQTSHNPRELVKMACVYASSDKAADQALLLDYLGSEEFLNRLNTADEYLRYPARNLEVARIVKTLMKQDFLEAHATIKGLTRNHVWQQSDPLIELLIRALVVDMPSSPETIVFWDKHSMSDSVYIPTVIEVIFLNRSEPALKLFEQKLNDASHDDEYQEIWLRCDLLRQRNELTVLQCCERMVIKGTVDEGWHNNIVEALFDYNEAWYLSQEPPRPPLRVLASEASKEVLGRIGKHALTNMDISIPNLRNKIKLAMEEIDFHWEKE